MVAILALVMGWFAFLWLAAGRVQKMQRGEDVPERGIINRFAHRQRRKMIARGRWHFPPVVPRSSAEQPSRKEWIASIDRSDIPEYGTWARFEYVDADGVVTNRHIRRWSKRGAYIEGFCMDRREGRTFRQDRIGDWVSG